ncbi:MAG TPA: ATP-binding cassette domain-containing protein [Candidatus Lumbricidophila sp.]|nr:ATP-binding cassette domain-containing protein [Candidatus Lumbricidophila sp.]
MHEPLTLSIKEATTGYRQRQIFQGLSLTLRSGITALLGPNGAGKSTLIEALATPDRLSAGSVLVNGKRVESGQSTQSYLANMGYLPQRWEAFDRFTPQECVEYVAWLKRVPKVAIRAAASAALQSVGLIDVKDDPLRRLSGGMRQRVALAESLVNNPTVLLLDEPTVGLDPEQRSLFRGSLAAQGNRIVLMSTHLTDDVQELAQRVLVVQEGRVLFDGPPDELAKRAPNTATSLRLEAGYMAVIHSTAGVR